MEPSGVCIIIVTFNSEHVIGSCLESLEGLNANHEILIVDNGSTDNTLPTIQIARPGTRIIRNKENLGFAAAVNIGAKKISSEFICLLNPDARINPNQVELLIKEVLKPGVGVVAPLISHPNAKGRALTCGNEPTIWRMFTHFSGLSRLSKRFPLLEGHYLLPINALSSRYVDWATGACLLIRSNVWDLVNGLSNRWFMYAEDIEFCHRVRLASWKIMLCSDVEVEHELAQSSRTNSSNHAIKSDWVINLYDYYRQNLSKVKLCHSTWKYTVSIGLYSRGIVFGIRSFISEKSKRDYWSSESSKFFSYSREIRLQ